MGLYLKFSLFGQTLINVRMCSQILVKLQNFAFYNDPLSCTAVFFCSDRQKEGQTVIMHVVRAYFQVLFRKLQKLHLLEVIVI